MTVRARRRQARDRRELTNEQALYLESGATMIDLDGQPPFDSEAEARAAWAQHRDALYRAVGIPGLIPWAAIVFDGVDGHSSPYCHLGDPGCHR